MSRPQVLLIGWFVLAGVVLARLTGNLYTPALPAIGTDLGMDKAALGLTMTVYLLCFAVGSLLAGSVSDSFGRRPVLILGLTGICIGCFLCGFSDNGTHFLLSRIVQALGACCIPVMGRVIIRESYQDDMTVLSLFGWIALISGIVPVLAPVLGGMIVETVGWRPVFFIPATLALIATIVFFYLLPETLPREKRLPFRVGDHLKSNGSILLDRTFASVMLPNAFSFMIQGAYMTLSPFILIQHFGCSPTFFGGTNLLIVASMLVGRRLVMHVVRNGGEISGFRLGGVLLLFGSTLLFLATLFDLPLSVVLAVVGVIGCGFGVLLPLGNLTLLNRFREQGGSVSSLYSFVTIASAGLGSAFATSLLFHGVQDLWAMASIALALSTATLFAVFSIRLSKSNDP